jgi:hypothetical protein
MADSPDTYTVKAAAAILTVSSETLRRYTGYYADWLSDSARPGPGKERKFTQEDIRTLAWCWSQARDSKTKDEIAKALPFVDDSVLPSWASLTGLGDESGDKAATQTGSTALDTADRMVKLLELLTDQKTDRERHDAEITELRSQVDALKGQVEALQQAPQPNFWDRLFGRKPPA